MFHRLPSANHGAIHWAGMQKQHVSLAAEPPAQERGEERRARAHVARRDAHARDDAPTAVATAAVVAAGVVIVRREARRAHLDRVFAYAVVRWVQG